MAKPAWAPTLAANTVGKPAWAPTLAANTVAKPTWALKQFVTKIYGKLNGVDNEIDKNYWCFFKIPLPRSVIF